jgi:hypothetical protein
MDLPYLIWRARAEQQATLGDRPVYETLAVAMYELGEVAKRLVYRDVPGADVGALSADAISEAGDCILQLYMLIDKLRDEVTQPVFVDGILAAAVEKQVQRMRELRK